MDEYVQMERTDKRFKQIVMKGKMMGSFQTERKGKSLHSCDKDLDSWIFPEWKGKIGDLCMFWGS